MKFTNNLLVVKKKNDDDGSVELKPAFSDEFKPSDKDVGLLKVRKAVFSSLNDPSYSLFSKIYTMVMNLIIFASVIAFVLESVKSINTGPSTQRTFFEFEIFFNVFFTLDYVLKIVFFPDMSKLVSYLFHPFPVIDLISILPFYIELAAAGVTDVSVLRIIRIVRIFRVFRLLKASRNLKQVHMVGLALKRSKEAILMLVFIVVNALFLFGAFMFYAEREVSTRLQSGQLEYNSGVLQGQQSGFQSIFDAMWWAIVTITTVGYGDLYF